MRALRAVVVDDEPHARADLTRILGELGVAVVGQAQDGPGALKQIDGARPDVVFLDIELPGLDGLAVAARGDLPPVVFVTAHPEHAPRAFDLDACDYVLKPVTTERVRRALERAMRRVAFESDASTRLEVRETGGTRYVDARLVEVFSAVDKYVAFTLEGEELLLRTSQPAALTRRSDSASRTHQRTSCNATPWGRAVRESPPCTRFSLVSPIQSTRSEHRVV